MRIVERRDRTGFRILWTEAGRQRERTATTEDDARRRAMEEAARLEDAGHTASGGVVSFGALVSAATRPEEHSWTVEWAQRVERIAGAYIVNTPLGQQPARDVRRRDIVAHLQALYDAGHSPHFVKKVEQLIKAGVRKGVERGVWQAGSTPIDGYRRPAAVEQDGRPDLDLVPTDGQVEALIRSMDADRPVYGAMARVAAYTGVRWGELLALRLDSVDFDARTLRVNLNCVEGDDGRFVFRRPLKATRREQQDRTVVLEWETVGDPLQRFVDEHFDDGLPAGPAVDGHQPAGLLFRTSTGNPFRRSAFGKVFDRHRRRVAAAVGWPGIDRHHPDDRERDAHRVATWHYLRHYAATRWLRLGVELPTVSRMLGHSQVSTTLDWYVSTDEQALARTQRVLNDPAG